MHSRPFQGRGGPRTSTPTSVRCQRCLERGHYTYECKTTVQERPYIKRPSRTQQLANPKLRPKLTIDSPNPAQKKEGLADAELARIEAEREHQRERRERDDELLEEGDRLSRGVGAQEPINRGRKRSRSVSSGSVSSYSSRSRSPSRSVSPRPSEKSRTNRPVSQDRLPPSRRGRDQCDLPGRSHSPPQRRRYDSSPRRRSVGGGTRSPSRRNELPNHSPSPPRNLPARSHHSKERLPSRRRVPSLSPAPSRHGHARQRSLTPDDAQRSPSPSRHRRARQRSLTPNDAQRHHALTRNPGSASTKQDPDGPLTRRPRYSRSRSPARGPPLYQGRERRQDYQSQDERADYRRQDSQTQGLGRGDVRRGPTRDRYPQEHAEQPRPQGDIREERRPAVASRREPESERERSLSPFSKRLAMTKALNGAR
jgi:hypothetical protein